MKCVVAVRRRKWEKATVPAVVFTSSGSFQSVVFSSPAVTSGERYAIHIGGSTSGAQTGGLHDGGNTAGSTHGTDVTAGVGGAGMQGPGGMPGGPPGR